MPVKRRLKKLKSKPRKVKIRKSKNPNKVKKLSSKQKAHIKLCDDLCNRLQGDEEVIDIAVEELADHANLVSYTTVDLAVELMQKFHCTIRTGPDKAPDYNTTMTYVCPQKAGEKQRTMSLPYASPNMALSVILCYIKLSKYLGRFF